MLNNIHSLAKVLIEIDVFPPDHFLFLPTENIWNASTPCLVMDLEDLDDADEPITMKGLVFQCTLQVATAQDIIENLKLQGQEINEDSVVKSFLFYFDNDAFIPMALS